MSSQVTKMDYKNILEGARPFFQGLPAPSQQNATAAAATPATANLLPLIPLAIPNSHLQQEASVIRSKFEEGLGATLSQLYGSSGISSLRSNPVSALSPKLNSSYPNKSPTSHLSLRGGSSSSVSVVSSIGKVGSSSPLPSTGNTNHKSGGGSASSSSQPTMVVRRESPLDLSVKTVRQSADSSTSTPTDTGTTNCTSTGVINIPQLNSSSRSLSNSGASTPINTGNTATNNSNSNHASSSVIAAVVNSTTGRDKEYESLKQPAAAPAPIQRLTPSQQPQQQHPPAHERVEVPNRAPSQPPPGFTTPNHHLFGHYPAHSPVPPNAAAKAYQYLSQPSAPDPASYRSQMPPTSKPYSGPQTNSVPTSTPSGSHQGQQQRPSSVIPPYNPPTPNFGVYHQAAGPHGPMHPAFNHSPYAAYQSQQPHQQQIHRYPETSLAYYGHSPYAHTPPSNPPTSSPSTNSQTTNVNGAAKPNEVNPYLRNSTPNNHGHQQPPGTPAPPMHPQYQQTNSSKEQPSHAQHYGLPPIQAPNSSYHHYPQYLPQHLVQNPVQIPHPNSSSNSSSHQPQQSGTPNSHTQAHQYHPGYPNSHLAQSRYGSPQPRQQPRFATPAHVPTPFSYHQPPGPPRTPVAGSQQPSPHHYSPLYPAHLAGPRQPTPSSQSPTPKQKKTSAIKAHNENSNSASSTNSGTSSHHRNSQGSKGGSSRKNVLNLLRNSLETRIHEKQEKEKTQYNHQTWSFHGRKITLPALPKPADTQNSANGPGSIAGGGSILTGMSNNSASSIGLNGAAIVGAFPDIFGINQRNSHGPFDDANAMTFHGSQELSPNADNSLASLQRIRTKAEKKQLFPNLLSQIEQQENNKHNSSFGQPKSVFDFDDEDDESKSKSKVKVQGRRNSSTSNKGSTPPHSSFGPSSSPVRKSGSKKFTCKLTKAKDYLNSTSGSTLTSNAIEAINAVIASAHASTSANCAPVTGPASSETKAVMSSFSAEPLDSFWAACDSFVDDLTKNPVSTKSKRGGLWAKLKAEQNKSKEDNNNEKGGSRKGGSSKRIRRNSNEEDEDFEISSKSEEEDVEEEEDEDEDSVHSQNSSDQDGDEDMPVGNKKKKTKKLEDDDEEDDDAKSSTSSMARKNTRSASQNKRGGSLVESKRKNSSAASSAVSPAKKSKKSKNDNQKKTRGIKVGNHTLRERRVTNLGLDLVEDDTSRSSIGSVVSDDDSDEDVRYSISDDDNSDDSDASSDSDSEDSESDSDEDDDELRNSDDSESVGRGRKTRTSTAGGSTKGKSRSPVSKRKSAGESVKGGKGKNTRSKTNKKSKKTKTKKAERKGRSLRSGRGGSVTRSSRRSSAKKDDTRKLRPKRNCVKGKEAEESGEGSSSEEWVSHEDLTKRKSRIVFGDGSDFRRPGWEEELIDFKKKLRMPSKLIRVAKPSSLASSSGVKDDMGNSPAKENKSPSKAVVEEPKPKGRTSKGGKTPTKDGKANKSDKKSEADSLDEPAIEKAVEKMTAAKKSALLNKKLDKDSEGQSKSAKAAKGTTKKSSDTPPTSKPAKIAKKGAAAKEETKSTAKVTKANKSTAVKEVTPSKDKDPQLLPTPGPAGLNFKKKMSIKSVFGVDPKEQAQPSTPPTGTPPTVAPRAKIRRNKFKSGFDYLRKKKKPTPTPDGSVAPAPKKPKISQEKNMSEEDVQAELRGWVLNKGLGETVLHRAARLGYVDVAAYSLEFAICSPNCKDNAGFTPLHECCLRGNLEVARVLLMYGANPSTAAPGGIRPLHEAAENGYVELVRLLLSFGADPLLATYAGQTPLELADQHEPLKSLITQHIQDVQGKAEKLWQFRGSGTWAEVTHDNGYDPTADPPLHTNNPFADGHEFEGSEAPLPPLYLLKGDSPYVLVQDLVTYVGVPRERLMKNHPAAELVELNSNDFLEEAHCCHLLGEKFNLNSSSDLLSLIKYDDRVKKMLNIESCIIK